MCLPISCPVGLSADLAEPCRRENTKNRKFTCHVAEVSSHCRILWSVNFSAKTQTTALSSVTHTNISLDLIIWHMKQELYDYHMWQKVRLKFRAVKWFAQQPSGRKNKTNKWPLLINIQALFHECYVCHPKRPISEMGKPRLWNNPVDTITILVL